MLLVYASLLVIGSVLAAAAQDPAMFIAGHVLQGLCTSLLLIAAVPPLALGFGVEKFRSTAMIMSMCIFGAVTLGPAIGGIQAEADAWRPLFWVIAGISAAALVLALLTFEDTPPADRSAPRNPLPIALAAAGSVAAFFGASELLTHKFLEFRTPGMLVGGLALIVVLIVYQYRAKRPLLTIRTMLSSTIPVAGIVLALCAAAASVSATALTASLLAERYSPLHVGLLYLPELAGALITAVLLGVVIDKRRSTTCRSSAWSSSPPGIAVFRIQLPPTQALTLIGSGLTGIGLGATRRAGAVHRRLLAARRHPAARLRDRRAAARRGGIHDRAGVRALRGHRRGRSARPARASRCGSASGSRSPAPSCRVADLRARRSAPGDAAARAVHGTARARRGTRRRCWPPPADARHACASPTARHGHERRAGSGPVVFAYDGCELAKHAIEEAGRLLEAGGEALVVTVWQPFDVGFLPAAGLQFDAAQIAEVRRAAAQTAAEGAALRRPQGSARKSAEIEQVPDLEGDRRVRRRRTTRG